MGLEGTWYNELGSTLNITQVQSGVLSGTYETAVSGGGCAQGSFSVVGVTDTDSGGRAVGFSVLWTLCQSVTSWSGQLLTDSKNGLYISAFWLLTQETSQAQSWAATNVGQDTFYQQKPSPQAIAERSKVVRKSHP